MQLEHEVCIEDVKSADAVVPASDGTQVERSLLSPRAAALEKRYAASLVQSSGTALDLSSLGLTELPSLHELGQRFPHLCQLNVRRNSMRLLPDGLAQAFPQLVVLNAAENLLEEVSVTSIGALQNLKRLNIAHNRLRELPIAAFEQLDALEELDVRGNLIEWIQFDSQAEAGLRQLQILLLADNRLNRIDSTTTDVLPQLRVIDLSGNPDLTNAPKRFWRLHERNLLLHSRAKRRELITRALSIRKAVAQALATAPAVSLKRTMKKVG